jgi:hypothetical protein
MDALPGFVHSGSDFYVTGGGLLITETTISRFFGFREDGIPAFDRIRRAAQTADSIDAFVRIMTTDGNGAYANDWLVGDRKTGEIARQVGLKNKRSGGRGRYTPGQLSPGRKSCRRGNDVRSKQRRPIVYVRRDRWVKAHGE